MGEGTENQTPDFARGVREGYEQCIDVLLQHERFAREISSYEFADVFEYARKELEALLPGKS